jgi:hypothetical protein
VCGRSNGQRVDSKVVNSVEVAIDSPAVGPRVFAAIWA